MSSFVDLTLPLNLPSAARAVPLILLVDDETLTRTQMRRFLEKQQYQIEEARDGQEGLERFKELRPDIVLMDALMPKLDGFECCAALQAIPEAAHIPVLMITGLNDEASVDRAFAAGAIDYVTKPIHWAVLRQRVRRLLQQAQLYQQLEAANRVLHHLATIDGLTQLPNRRQLDSHLEQEFRRTARDRQPLSVILCDVDFFKRYNDCYGHQAGDECLRQVAQAVASTVRRSGDLAARYGGEEFAVVLPTVDEAGAICVAELIQAAIAALQLPHPQASVSPIVTLSLGIATTHPHMAQDSPGTLITAADKALYAAKAQGRDRYCVHLGTVDRAL